MLISDTNKTYIIEETSNSFTIERIMISSTTKY